MMAQQPSMRDYSTDLWLARRHGNNVDGLAKLDLLQFLPPKYAPACILTVNRRLLSAISRHWLTVNATSKPPHIGASRAYLEDVTAAEFCEEGRHGSESANPVAQFLKARLFQHRIGIDIRLNVTQWNRVIRRRCWIIDCGFEPLVRLLIVT